MNCVESKLKKYTSRKSPPYPANECPEDMIKKGNDGLLYIIKKGSNGIHRWMKYREMMKKSKPNIKKPEGSTKLTIPQIRQHLDKLGIHYKKSANKANLLDLLPLQFKTARVVQNKTPKEPSVFYQNEYTIFDDYSDEQGELQNRITRKKIYKTSNQAIQQAENYKKKIIDDPPFAMEMDLPPDYDEITNFKAKIYQVHPSGKKQEIYKIKPFYIWQEFAKKHPDISHRDMLNKKSGRNWFLMLPRT